MFSKPAKETKDPEEEIFEELEKITFHFGDKEPTVGEANLAFVHEIKMELRRVYVIALSENYGTILFYLPEKLTEKIAGRVAQLSIGFENYLYNLIEWRPKTLELSYALAKCSYTAEEAANSLMLLSAAMKEKPLAPTSVRIRSNNWLKLHGYPMRRRKGRRHYE